MKSISMLLFLFITIGCFSQVQHDLKTKQFLNEFVKTEKKDNLYFGLYLNPRTIDRVVRSLDYRDSDSTYRDVNNQKVVFVLTVEEKALIKKTWLSQKNKMWDTTILENVDVFREKPIPANFTKEERLQYLKQFEGKHIIRFSLPVFLRNDSLCIFFYESWGGGAIYVMKKENNKWVKSLVKTIFVS